MYKTRNGYFGNKLFYSTICADPLKQEMLLLACTSMKAKTAGGIQ